MKRRTKQFVTACLIVAAVTGTGAVSARADYHGIPDKVTLAQSQRSVTQGKKFEVKAQTSPYDAEDDYICWEIVSGNSYVQFEDSDRTGDDMDFVAVKPGTAKIRCYVYGKNKERYGDTIKVSVTEAKKDYSLRKCGTTKITCSYTNSKGEKKSVVYTVNVVAADDD